MNWFRDKKHQKKMLTAVGCLLGIAIGVTVMTNMERQSQLFDPSKYEESLKQNSGSLAFDEAVFGGSKEEQNGLELDQQTSEDYNLEEGDTNIKDEEQPQPDGGSTEIAVADSTADDSGTNSQPNKTPGTAANDGTGNAIDGTPSGTGTNPDNGGTTPDGGGTTPDGGGGTTPDDGGGTTPDDGGGTTPDDGGGTTPDDGGGTTPDDGGGTTPDDGGGTTPDDGGGTTPDDGGGTTPDDGGDPAEPDPDEDKYGTDYTEPEEVDSDYPDEAEDTTDKVSSTKLKVSGSLMQYFYPGETPRTSELLKYITVSATMSNGDVRQNLQYQQDAAYGGDYTIQWSSAAGSAGQDVGTKSGTYTARICYRGQQVELQYNIVKWQVTLLDFEEPNVAESNRYHTVLYPNGSPQIALKDRINEMYNLVQERTEDAANNGTQYQYINQVVEQKSGSSYCTQYFGGWADVKTGGTGMGYYYLMNRPAAGQVVGGVYNVNLYPTWVNVDDLPDYKIVLTGSRGGAWATYLLEYTGTDSTITIPEGVNQLNLTGMYYCGDGSGRTYPNVKKIVIPQSLSDILFSSGINYVNPFPNLEEIEVSVSNQSLLDIDGIVYNKTGKKLLLVPAGKTSIKKWSSKVECIGGNAFQGVKMSSVSVPDSVTELEEEALFNATISTLTLNTTKQLTWGGDAFSRDYKNSRNNFPEADDASLIGKIVLKSTQLPSIGTTDTELLRSLAFSVSTYYGVNPSTLQIIVPHSTGDELYLSYLAMMQQTMDERSGNEALLGMTYQVLNTPSNARSRYQQQNGILLSADGKQLVVLSGVLSGDVVVPETVTTVAAKSMRLCNKIVSLSLPAGIKTIAAGALDGGTALSTLLLPAQTPPTLGTKIFGASVPAGLKIYVQDAAVYLSAWGAQLDREYGTGTAQELFVTLPGNLIAIGDGIYISNADGSYTLVRYNTTAKSAVVAEHTSAIAESAFSGCADMRFIVFPSTLTTMGSNLFVDCCQLQGIALQSAAPMAEHTFTGKDGLACYIPQGKDYSGAPWDGLSIHEISDTYQLLTPVAGSLALYGNSGSEQVLIRMVDDMPQKLSLDANTTAIYPNALAGATELTSVQNAYHLTDIGAGAFEGCANLERVVLSLSNSDQRAITLGKACFKNCSALRYFGIGQTLNLVLPAGIQTVSEQAFYGCTGLTGLTLGAGVKTIGASAFYGCTNLTSIIPNAALTTIGDYAFYGTGLANLSIAASAVNLTTLGEYAFAECRSMVYLYLPDTVTSIGKGCFKNCTSMLGINVNFTDGTKACAYIPTGVSELRAETFYGCSSLPYLYIRSGITTIGDSCFYGCSDLTDIYWFNSATTGPALTSIGDYAFYACNLAGLNIARTATMLKTVGKYAFAECRNLYYMYLSDTVTSLGEGCFQNCTKMVGINAGGSIGMCAYIPTGVKKLEAKTFAGCTSLAYLYIRSAVTSIGESCCEGCTAMKTMNWNSTGSRAAMSSIGKRAFYQTGLTSASFLYYTALTNISEESFASCPNLGQVLLPLKLTSMEKRCFAGSGISLLYFYAIPQTVGENCFADCTAMTEVHIRVNGTMNLPESTFTGCTKVATLEISDLNGNVGTLLSQSTLKTLQLSTRFAADTLTADDLSDYSGVTTLTLAGSIGTLSGSFSSWRNLTIVNVTGKLTKLADGVFQNCDSLFNLSFASSSNLTTIGASACEGCTDLDSVSIPATVTSLGARAFAGCVMMYEVDIPTTLTNIGAGAYADCTGLELVTVNHFFDYESVFSGCTDVVEVTLDADFEKSELSAADLATFSGVETLTVYGTVEKFTGNYSAWSKLAYVEIDTPNTTELDAGLFEGCTALESGYFSDASKIGSRCFANCTVLDSVDIYYKDGDPEIAEDAFVGCPDELEIWINDDELGSSFVRAAPAPQTEEIPADPSAEPEQEPDADQSAEPEQEPDAEQSAEPEQEPDAEQSAEPEQEPDAEQSAEPEQEPDADQSAEPEQEPDADQSAEPEQEPDADQSAEPEQEPDAEQSAEPEQEPDAEQSAEPEQEPDAEQSAEPEQEPDAEQSAEPEPQSEEPAAENEKKQTADSAAAKADSGEGADA